MPTNKKTKIVATLGPACSTRAVLKDMIDAGVNVFRVNFSHADYTDVKERIDLIRESKRRIWLYYFYFRRFTRSKITRRCNERRCSSK